MLVGLQTTIEWPVPLERLREVKSLGVQLARIAAMECDRSLMMQNKWDAEAAGLTPVVTIWDDPERIRLFSPGDMVEAGNEFDGDIAPSEYRRVLDGMAAIALETGVLLWGGVGSNTDKDTFQWGRDVRGDGWPAGMFGLSWHSYGPYPHGKWWERWLGLVSFEKEMAELKELAAGLPILLSEFGDPTRDPQRQAAIIADLWQQWIAQDFWGASLFQIVDGPDKSEREHCYGIYECDADGTIGALKPVAYTFPR